MRFGCCVNMLVPFGQGTGVEYVERVAAAGFDYLELPVVRIAALSEAEFAALCRACRCSRADHGVVQRLF